MRPQQLFSTLSQIILLLAALSVILVMMGCASGTTKIEAWKFDEDTIKEVQIKCTGSFEPATSGTLADLWVNKRLILRKSRDCSEAANKLAEQALNRNKVIAGE